MSADAPRQGGIIGAMAVPADIGPREEDVRRIRRDPDAGMIAGVCAAIAGRAGIDPIIIRLAFVAAALFSGAGLIAYALAWIFIPARQGGTVAARLRPARGNIEAVLGIGLLVLSAALLLRAVGWWVSDAVVWPAIAAAIGGALIWRQFVGPAGAAAAEAAPGPVQAEPRVEPLPGARRLSVAGVGVALVLGAALVFLWANGALDAAGDAVLATVVVVVALGLILAPVWWRLGRNLAAERAERIRSQERAELGAHLHDSVLQTLALMQRRADDPREVAALARRQERELRGWLLDRPPARARESLAGALEAAAARVEESHGGGIEVVTVGDCALDNRAEALLAAAGEAILNAAKFAGDAGPIDVFAEVTPRRIGVFVRDRGPGFDPGSLPDDRRGVRESIIGRMERHGGRTEIRTGADGGTEVELSLERGAS
ncbi:MAG: PspC domain-containing protein [Candidatus Limnocylindria bacterium]